MFKIEIFEKIKIMAKNRNFGDKLKLCLKLKILQKLKLWLKMEILAKNSKKLQKRNSKKMSKKLRKKFKNISKKLKFSKTFQKQKFSEKLTTNYFKLWLIIGLFNIRSGRIVWYAENAIIIFSRFILKF